MLAARNSVERLSLSADANVADELGVLQRRLGPFAMYENKMKCPKDHPLVESCWPLHIRLNKSPTYIGLIASIVSCGSRFLSWSHCDGLDAAST